MNRPARPSQAELRRGEAAAWGPRPSHDDRQRMRLLAFTPRVKGVLRGFATVELPIGLRVHDVLVFAGDKGQWAALPTKPQLDRERRPKIGADGKPLFAPVAEWRSRELTERFSAAVVALVRAQYPDALV